jgi:hypothetical protein
MQSMIIALNTQLSDAFNICGSSLWFSYVCGLPAPSQPAILSQGMEVRLGTYPTRGTHPANGGSIVLGQPAVAWCAESTADLVNNARNKIHEVFFVEPAVTSCSVVLYSLTSSRCTSFRLNRRKVLSD